MRWLPGASTGLKPRGNLRKFRVRGPAEIGGLWHPCLVSFLPLCSPIHDVLVHLFVAMKYIKSILCVYARSFEFHSTLPRPDFARFALFFIIMLAVSYQMFGTVMIGFALTALPLLSVVIRRARDIGFHPASTIFLLCVPLLVGILLLLPNFLLENVFGTEIPGWLFDGIVKLSAICAWSFLVLLLFASTRGAQPAPTLSDSPQQSAAPTSPVETAQRAKAQVHALSDRIAEGLGIELQPPPDVSALSAPLGPVMDTVAEQVAKYAHGTYAPRFDDLEQALKAAFRAGGWTPLAAPYSQDMLTSCHVTRSVLQGRVAQDTAGNPLSGPELQDYWRSQLDAFEDTLPKMSSSVHVFDLQGHSNRWGLLTRDTPDNATTRFSLELFLDADMEQALWPLAHRPEITMAFPRHFENVTLRSFHIDRMLRGHSPRQYRDGLSTEFFISKPAMPIKNLVNSKAITLPDVYLKFEMIEVMR